MLDGVKHLSLGDKSIVRLSLVDSALWKGLPRGYTPLDYIEATGTQYIDTGVILNQDSRIICEYMYKGGNGIYGARNTVATRNFSLRVISGAWQMGYGDGVTSGKIKSDTTKWHVADQNKNSLYIDGVLCVTREYVKFNTPKTCAIGAIKAGSIYYGEGLYHKFQLYDDGVLVRDMIACQNPEGVAGMYDLLNAQFYRSAGTEEFVVPTNT